MRSAKLLCRRENILDASGRRIPSRCRQIHTDARTSKHTRPKLVRCSTVKNELRPCRVACAVVRRRVRTLLHNLRAAKELDWLIVFEGVVAV